MTFASMLHDYPFASPGQLLGVVRDDPDLIDESQASFQHHLELVRQADRYDISRVTQLLFESGQERELTWEQIPSVLPPSPLVWLETRAPSIPSTENARRPYLEFLPSHWGWLIETVPPQNEQAFDMALQGRGGTEVEGVVTRLVATQAIQVRAGQPVVSMPLVTFLMQVGDDGRLLAQPSGAFAFPGKVKQSAVGVLTQHADLASIALRSALLALSFLRSEEVELIPHRPSPATQRRRARHRQSPAMEYSEMDLTRIVDVLRFEGQFGLVGLGKALEALSPRFGRKSPSGLVFPTTIGG